MGNYIDIEYVEGMINTQFDALSSPNKKQVEKFIAKAEFDFETEFGIYREQTGIVQTIDGSWDVIFANEYLPLNNITQLELNNGTLFDEDWTIQTSDTYKLFDSETGQIALSYGTKGVNNYKVTVDTGYSTVNMPINIKYLIYLMVMRSVFNNTLLNTQGQNNTTETIDVDVYKEVTRGGSFYVNGLRDIDALINEEKVNFRGKLHTYLY